MRTLLVLTSIWAGMVSTQCFSSIPQCAQICVTNAATQSTSCGSTDWECQCTSDNHQTIMQSAQNCMFASCGQAMTEETVKSAVAAFCSAVNAGDPCSSSTTAGGTSTTFTSTTTSASEISKTSTTGTRTSTTGTATAATSSSTAGAAVVGHVGSFGMMVLGALALI